MVGVLDRCLNADWRDSVRLLLSPCLISDVRSLPAERSGLRQRNIGRIGVITETEVSDPSPSKRSGFRGMGSQHFSQQFDLAFQIYDSLFRCRQVARLRGLFHRQRGI